MTFTDLLEQFLAARAAYRVTHGPLYEDYLRAKDELNEFMHSRTLSEEELRAFRSE